MKNLFLFIIFSLAILSACNISQDDSKYVSYTSSAEKIKMWNKDETGTTGSLGNLKLWAEKHNEKLVFAMNGGMYKPDGSAQGLFIKQGRTILPLDTLQGKGNFYLQPNGVFYITNNDDAAIILTEKFSLNNNIKYATQSGPMLVIDGQLHHAFMEGSKNLQIRNGVGILTNGDVLFAMSKGPVNFYDFAMYFKNNGCKNALYLDGYVSRTHLPEKGWTQTDGNFAVIIGVTE